MATTMTDTEFGTGELRFTIDFGGRSVAGLYEDGQWESYRWLTADDRMVMALIAAGAYTVDAVDPEACLCGHVGADHCREAVLSPTTHRCIRCDCTFFESRRPRFEATVVDRVPTVRDNETGLVIRHQGVWDEAFSADVARDLELTPGAAHLLTWEAE